MWYLNYLNEIIGQIQQIESKILEHSLQINNGYAYNL